MVLHIVEHDPADVEYHLDDPRNILVLCQGCSKVRREIGDQMDEFFELVVALGPFKVDEKGFLFKTPAVAHKLNDDDERIILNSAGKRNGSSARQGWKRGTADLFDDCKTFCRAYVGEGRALCASGLVLPIEFFEFDRKDPLGLYHPENMRPYFRAFNLLRNDPPNDTPTATYLNAVWASHKSSATP